MFGEVGCGLYFGMVGVVCPAGPLVGFGALCSSQIDFISQDFKFKF